MRRAASPPTAVATSTRCTPRGARGRPGARAEHRPALARRRRRRAVVARAAARRQARRRRQRRAAVRAHRSRAARPDHDRRVRSQAPRLRQAHRARADDRAAEGLRRIHRALGHDGRAGRRRPGRRADAQRLVDAARAKIAAAARANPAFARSRALHIAPDDDGGVYVFAPGDVRRAFSRSSRCPTRHHAPTVSASRCPPRSSAVPRRVLRPDQRRAPRPPRHGGRARDRRLAQAADARADVVAQLQGGARRPREPRRARRRSRPVDRAVLLVAAVAALPAAPRRRGAAAARRAASRRAC